MSGQTGTDVMSNLFWSNLTVAALLFTLDLACDTLDDASLGYYIEGKVMRGFDPHRYRMKGYVE